MRMLTKAEVDPNTLSEDERRLAFRPRGMDYIFARCLASGITLLVSLNDEAPVQYLEETLGRDFVKKEGPKQDFSEACSALRDSSAWREKKRDALAKLVPTQQRLLRSVYVLSSAQASGITDEVVMMGIARASRNDPQWDSSRAAIPAHILALLLGESQVSAKATVLI